MKTLVALLLVAMTTVASAQSIKLNGQIRERSEIDARSFTVGTNPDVYHLLRTRFGATSTIDSQITAVVELQDARSFGQTQSTFNNGSPAFDLRQAYIDIRRIGGLPLELKLGRQTLAYANERLLSKVEWSNFAQSFDAAVASLGNADLKVDLLGAALARNPNTTAYKRDVFLAGAWCAWKPAEVKASVQAYYLFDDPNTGDTIRQNRHTAGLYTNGTFGSFDYEIDGAMQFGDYTTHQRINANEVMTKERTISASMIGARAGYAFTDMSGLHIGVGYDRLSGQNPDASDKYGAFNPLYGLAHRFYGYMDIVDNVSQTKGLGLQDMILQISVVPAASMKVEAELHQFALATNPSKMNPWLTLNNSQWIGRELDLTASFKATGTLSLTAGYSVFDGDPDRFVARGRKTTQWGYLTTSVGF
jgi:hypothetical protein